MRKQDRYFCATFAFSLAVHLFVLTLLFTIPKTEAPEGYKRVRVKLGTGKLKVADELANARKYAEYEPGAGLSDVKAVDGNSDKNAEAIPLKTSEVISQKANDEAVKESLRNMILNQKNSAQAKNAPADKKKGHVVAQSQPQEVKKIEEQVAKKEIAPEPNNAPEKAELQEADEEESTIIGNSVAPTAEKMASYEQMLPLWLEKFKQYPEEAKAFSASGIGEIFLKIDRKGKILLSKIIKTTGNPALDRALTKMMTEADPVLPVPQEYYPDKKTFSYKIAIEFERPISDQ